MKRGIKIRRLMYFSRSENRGILVLIALLVVLIAVHYFQRSKFQKFDLHFIKSEIPLDTESSELTQKKYSRFEKGTGNTSEYFILRPFDPNTASLNILNSLGIPPYISNRIIKYRESGGSYSEPADLYLIYGIDSSLVQSLIEHIEIDEQFRSNRKVYRSKNYSELKIDINIADTTQFARLSGIGPVLSKRIINYRNSVGGFYSADQLKEVYGIDDSLYYQLEGNLLVDDLQVKKINLNTTNFEELFKHPYISRYEAKAILGYRRISGKITAMTELRENFILSESTYQKAVHYFQID